MEFKNAVKKNSDEALNAAAPENKSYTREEVNKLLEEQEERLTKKFLSFLSPLRTEVKSAKQAIDNLNEKLEEIYSPIKDERRRAAQARSERWLEIFDDDEDDENE